MEEQKTLVVEEEVEKTTEDIPATDAPTMDALMHDPNAPVITMRKLLEAGAHFGHQTRRWNPKMKNTSMVPETVSTSSTYNKQPTRLTLLMPK